MNKLIALPILLLLVSSCDKDAKKSEETNKPRAAAAAKADKETPKPAPVADKVEKKEVPVEKKAATSEYVSADHKFSVQTLRQPRVDNTSTETAVGKINLTTYMFSAKGAPGAYGVMVSQLPFGDDTKDAARIKAIDDAQAGLIAQYSGTLSNIQELKLDGSIGREFDLQATHPQMGPMSGHYKIVLRDKNMYQIMRISAPDATGLIAEAASLLSSFKLTD